MKVSRTSILAWHFVGDTLRDGRPIPADGEWLEHIGALVMCASGLHASKRLIDALHYAPGSTICRVELDGEIIEDDDKIVATRRRILWRIEGGDILREFARWCALEVAHLWVAMPDIVREYLETGNEEKRAASWAASWAAAGRAAGVATWDGAATRDAARAAAWAARAAARAAAWAARVATWDGAATRAAARAAAWAARVATWDGGRDAQNARLEQMVMARREVESE